MPIHLTTGLPGSGKTLHTLIYVKALSERENRPVYYHGINDLALSWQLLDDPKQWNSLPEGSIIVIDECQDLYPVHETKLSAEPHVLLLAKHRHRGYDIFLISQHPMNVHAFIRRLIDKHFHLIRAFGMQTANIHEWNRVIDYPEKTKKDSQTTIFKYPKEAYKYYKSAEVHTIQRKIPKKIYMVLAIPLFLCALGYLAWSKLSPQHQREQFQAVAKINGQDAEHLKNVNYQDSQKKLTYVESHTPQLIDFPHTAPAFEEVVKPVVAPYPAACVQMHGTCKCYTQQGTKLQTSESVCKQIVDNGFFVEWEQKSADVITKGVKDQVYPARDVDRDFTNAVGMRSRTSPNNPSAT